MRKERLGPIANQSRNLRVKKEGLTEPCNIGKAMVAPKLDAKKSIGAHGGYPVGLMRLE